MGRNRPRYTGIVHDLRGQNNGAAKLTDDDVRGIRRLYRRGWMQREIADLYEIAQSNVSYIVRHERWAHLDPREDAPERPQGHR